MVGYLCLYLYCWQGVVEVLEVPNILVDFYTNHFDPIYYSTTGYPGFWESVYRNSIEHFSEVWGKVGPLYFFDTDQRLGS